VQRLLTVLVLVLLAAVAMLGVAIFKIGRGLSTPSHREARPRDANGDVIVTDEDVEFFLKVHERVLRQRRIDSSARGAMLQVDLMEEQKEINRLPDNRRKSVAVILWKYAAIAYDLDECYLRAPDERVSNLPREQRWEELADARAQLVSDGQRELDAVVGADDARKISRELHRAWGLHLPSSDR
jgi:hypothetical protein